MQFFIIVVVAVVLTERTDGQFSIIFYVYVFGFYSKYGISIGPAKTKWKGRKITHYMFVIIVVVLVSGINKRQSASQPVSQLASKRVSSWLAVDSIFAFNKQWCHGNGYKTKERFSSMESFLSLSLSLSLFFFLLVHRQTVNKKPTVTLTHNHIAK